MDTAAARDRTAVRLLDGSVKRSFDPAVDIDWDAPLDPAKYFLPPEMVSLYDTPLWRRMDHAQRVELSRQELASTLSVGHWFENVLNQSLLRMVFHADPTSKHVHYALTEVGDETRHMVMFGRAIDRIGARPFRRHPLLYRVAHALPLVLRGSALWVAALVGEEIFDYWQRKMMRHPDLQPIVSQLMRIHVTEEARHISYAREGLTRRWPHAGLLERHGTLQLLKLAGPFIADALAAPQQYARAGLDPVVARRTALANPHYRATKAEGFDRLRRFLDENGLMTPSVTTQWRRAGFIA